MNKRIITTILLALFALTGLGQTIIWDEVVTGFANVPYLKLTRVAMYDDHTDITLHINAIKGMGISIAPNTVLKADGHDYAVKEVTTLTIGEEYTMPDDTLSIVLTFEPLPATTKKFDFVEPEGWQMLNVRSADYLSEGIVDTYWRDEATGDWLMGFAPNHVIYQNKVWDIVSQTGKKDAYALTISDGTTIKVGKMKKDLRTITIGQNKPLVCSPITGESLPDYPTKDLHAGFVDNGYDPTDSVTIIGWLKDMPEQAWGAGKEFAVALENIITDNDDNAYAVMDSLGRFSFKMSVLNSTEAFLDWGRSTVQTFLEPGKTYFFLYDFATGQKLWMGDDVRVQNELLAHPRFHAEAKLNGVDIDVMAYWAKADSVRQVLTEYHQTLQLSHPTLSQRYIDYVADHYRMELASDMIDAQFRAKNLTAPQEYVDYVYHEFWQNAPKPYTLYRDFDAVAIGFPYLRTLKRPQESFISTLKKFEKDGLVTLSPEERRAIDDYAEGVRQVDADMKTANTEEEQKKIVDSFNSTESVATLNALLQRCSGLVSIYFYQQTLDVIDSLGCDQSLRDLILAHLVYQMIDGNRQPEDSTVMAFVEQQIKMPVALSIVKSQNDKYNALQQRDISKSPSLKSADDVANMSEGEKILRKIIEPYKGKLILIDIWGTWCGPCLEALSHSAEEYERLKDIDIVFLYLANKSNDEAWKAVITRYNVTGDNVVHYNLPEDQQGAVEHFLGVSGYPTYKLIDRDGSVLNVNADPRELDGLVRLLKKM